MGLKAHKEKTPVDMESLDEEESEGIIHLSTKHQTFFSEHKTSIKAGAIGIVLLIVTYLLVSNFTCSLRGYEKTVLFYPTLELPINFIWIG